MTVIVMLGTSVYLVRKPRVAMAFADGPRVAEIGPGGEPIFPVGVPHCRRRRAGLPARHPALRALSTTSCS